MFHVCKDVLCKDESGVHQTYEILASGTVCEILMAAFTFRRFIDYRHNSSGYREIPDLNFLDTVLSAHLTEAFCASYTTTMHQSRKEYKTFVQTPLHTPQQHIAGTSMLKKVIQLFFIV